MSVTAHTDDYQSPRADLIAEILAKEAAFKSRLEAIRTAAQEEQRALQNSRIAAARAGVGSSVRFDSAAAGVASRFERMA